MRVARDIDEAAGDELIRAATTLHDLGYWVVVIYPRRFKGKDGKLKEGKEPFGKAWGAERRSLSELREQIRYFVRQGYLPGIGICLGPGRGPGGGWLADVEGDGPEAEASCAVLFGGEVVETRGWGSARGGHRLLLVDPARLAALMPLLSGCEGKGTLGAGVYHFDELPGLELRAGGTKDDGTPKQIQSVCPPTPGTDGKPREWNGVGAIAAAPEAFYATLGQIAEEMDRGKRVSAEPSSNGSVKLRIEDDDRAHQWLAKALENASGRVAMARVETRHDTLLHETRALAGYLHYGRGYTEDDLIRVMTEAGNRADRGNPSIADTVLDAIRNGKANPLRLKDELHDLTVESAGRVELSDDEEECPVEVRPWPEPPEEAAYHGLAGDFVRLIAPHSEADPVAILAQFLVCFGNVIGRKVYFQVESTQHHMNLYAALVGATSKARKGTSWDHVRSIMSRVDSVWEEDHIQFGLSSGEGLIFAVRDKIIKNEPVKKDGKVIEYQDVIVDQGVKDKRLQISETELGSTLKVLTREGNTLSGHLRNGWDHGNLRNMTKNSPLRATGAHISIVGHVTRDELTRNLTETEAANGFANRFLWLCVRRSRLLPFGGNLRADDLNRLYDRLSEAIAKAGDEFQLQFSDDARDLWAEVYGDLSEARPGLLGAILGRAEAQTRRLAGVYSLLDCEQFIFPEHLRAALAFWRFAERSARFIFGEAMGDPDADRLLAALRSAPGGLSRTQIRVDVFQKNKSSARIAQILGRLLERNLVRTEKIDTGGHRPTEMWYAINAINAVQPRVGRTNGVNGVNGVHETLQIDPAAAAAEDAAERAAIQSE